MQLHIESVEPALEIYDSLMPNAVYRGTAYARSKMPLAFISDCMSSPSHSYMAKELQYNNSGRSGEDVTESAGEVLKMPW
jgi:hypothetical protein